MEIKTVDVQALQELLDRNEVVLIDVREVDEHSEASIPSAINIPLGIVTIELLPKNNSGKKLVLHCGGGGRSAKACEKLIMQDSDIEVYNLTGGIRSWKGAGYAVNGAGIISSNMCAIKVKSE